MRFTKSISVLAGCALLTGLTVMGSVATAASAGAVTAAPACGSTVTTNLTLSGDIGPCNTDGLIVVVDNVSINLNGHAITGNGNYESKKGPKAGIHILGHHGVKVNGPGSISLFNAGVDIDGGSQNRVLGITTTLNKACKTDRFPAPTVCANNNMGDGILMVSSNNNEIKNNTATFNANANVASGGISMVFDSSQNHVIGNTVADNFNTGIRVEAGNGLNNVIERNTILRNQGNGVTMSFGAAGTQVLNNDIENNPFSGVSASFDANNVLISGNKIMGSSNGVNVNASSVTVVDNTVMSNTANGIAVGGGDVFTVEDGSVTGDFIRRNNVVRSNKVQNNASNGIVVFCTNDFVPANATGSCLNTTYTDANGQPISPSENDKIVSNIATGNGGTQAGILVRDQFGLPSGNFDLLDQNENPPCDHNTWQGNTANTGFPACTLK